MTSVENSSSQQDSTSTSSKPSFFHRHSSKTEVAHLPDQLLRLRIIDGQFDGLKQALDTYAVVSIGRQSARTKVVKGTNRPVFEENFAIGYAQEDLKSEIVIDLFERKWNAPDAAAAGDADAAPADDRLGEFRLRLSQVDPPKARKSNQKKKQDPGAHYVLPEPKQNMDDIMNAPPSKSSSSNADSWAKARPRPAVLVNRKGEEVGFLNILVRREARLHGNLNVHVREIDLAPSNQDFWNTPTHIVAKLGQERFESPAIDTSQGQTRLPFAWDLRFLVNDNNNISDVFFELWQSGRAVSEARLPLYDTRKVYNGSLAFIAPFGGHDVTNTNEKNVVANLILTSEFENQMLA